jgi:REP element-mobilizing transposase RayT
MMTTASRREQKEPGRRVRKRRPLKRHVQQDLFARTKRRRRPGARPVGRPPKGTRAGSPHKARPTLAARYPVHVVLRVVPELGNLRKRRVWKALRWATICAAKREDFRIVQASLQRTHIHLLVEAENKTALSRGMQGFQISAAKLINAAVSVKREVRRRGRVFADRFHQEIIKTPRQARHALAYVLNNWRKHREDRADFARRWPVDPFSTGIQFSGWKELDHRDVMWRPPETYQGLIVWFPRTWLLGEGWRRHGLIRCAEVPSAAHARPARAARTRVARAS